MEMKPGFYPADQLPNDEYQRGPGISQSKLKNGPIGRDGSWARLKAVIDGKRENKQTKPMFMGTALHAAFLEPHLFDDEYIVAPAKFKDGRAAGLKAWKEEQDPRLNVLLTKEYDVIMGMREALHSHPEVSKWIKGAIFEMSLYAYPPEDVFRDEVLRAMEAAGVEIPLCRCRFDIITPGGLTPDLKKVNDASDYVLSKKIADMGYYMQAAWYGLMPRWYDGTGIEGMPFIAIEDAYPHEINIKYIEDEDVKRGERQIVDLLNGYAMCLAKDHWPSRFETRPGWISLPDWKRTEIDTTEITA